MSAERYLLENGADRFNQEDGLGLLLLESSGNADIDHQDEWWAGAQRCFVAVAIAATVAVGQTAAQAQAITTQDQGEIWEPVSRGGSGLIMPIFIDSSRGKYFQPFEFEQHDRASPPLDESPYDPPQPWPATTWPAFTDTDTWPEPPPPPPDPVYAEADYLPPLPWYVAPQPLLWWAREEWPEPPPPPTEVIDDQAGYVPPLPWPATAPYAALRPTDVEEFGPPQPAPEIRVTEDHYFPPKPWGQGYVLRPVGGSGSRVEPIQIGTIQVTDDQYAPPPPWPVPPRPLLLFAQDEWPTPPTPIVGEDQGYQSPRPWGEWTYSLWIMDEAPPSEFTEDEYQPPRPWPVSARYAQQWEYEPQVWPTPAPGLQVDIDPWPLPRPWIATAHQALVWPQDEWPTPVEPAIRESDPWPLPAAWVPPIGRYVPGHQDEISTVGALGSSESDAQPVLVTWLVPQPAQPPIGHDERPQPAPLSDETDELFPITIVQRTWHVPQPWIYEQQTIAFLSAKLPLKIRDYSGPRYIVEDFSATRYKSVDDSEPRYEVSDG